MDLQMTGKVALVTGASAGLGRTIATILAEEGCKLAILARRRHLLEELAAELPASAEPLVIVEDFMSPGAALAAFGSYMLERKVSRYKHEFGTGAIEGVAGPEAANNAAAQTSFIPLLTLGIPANAVMALMVGALIIQGIQPGPRMVEAQPDLFWGLICSMWVGNLMLLVINLPLIGMWVKLLEVPYRHMYPSILIFCAIGVYSLNNNVFDVYLTVLFGLFGYLCSKLKMEPAPLLIGFVLGPMMEEHLRRAMLLSRGDPMVFIERPISATLLGIGFLALAVMLLPNLRSKKEAALAEGG
jgi:TctA family transporter